MFPTLHAAWALMSKPMLVANTALMLASASLFHWILPRLPGEIPLRIDLYGHSAGAGDPHELWLMGAVMVAALVLPAAAALAASSGLLDPSRKREHRPLLVANRRHIVRLVESLVLGVNLTIASGWLALSAGQLPSRRLPLSNLPSVSLLVILMAMLVPAALVLPKHLRLHRHMRALSDHYRQLRHSEPDGEGRRSTPAQWLPPRLITLQTDARPYRVPLWVAVLLLSPLVLWIGLMFLHY